mgnify:CR=1 FL=1
MKKHLALLLALVFVLPALPAMGLSIEGKNYSATVTKQGKSMKLIGVGLREKWFFDVYTMGSYSESRSCQIADIVNKDEAKYLRLDLLRDVSAEKMANTIGESFGEHMPKNASPELKKQRKTFESYFKKECTEGTVLEFVYIPGQGTFLYQNGAEMGAVLKGKEFHAVLWDIYFGKETCCEDLKESIMKTCK